MKKQYLLIPAGIVLIVIGGYIMSYSVKAEYFVGRSWMEAQQDLYATDYYIGASVVSLGFACLVVVVMWKRISSKNKR